MSTEKILLGHEIDVAGHGRIALPKMDPLLFNAIYFLTCNNREAEAFELNFPGWDMYLEGYGQKTEMKYNQVHHAFLIAS